MNNSERNVILFFGNSNSFSTAKHRSDALKRLGFKVILHDPYLQLKSKLTLKYISYFNYITGYFYLQKYMLFWINDILKKYDSDKIFFVWIDQGELFGENCINAFKNKQLTVMLYNNDDPTGNRDGNRFKMVMKSLKLYDLTVVVRESTKQDCINLKAKRVLRVFMSYDEFAHNPLIEQSQIKEEFKSDVTFIGTWMRHEYRDEFLLKLLNAGISIAIWGDRWQKSPHWNVIKPFFRGTFLGGNEYIQAIQGAKICLGLLSKGNRDLHTQRSLEIPYAGGLLCAERTSEHLAMYNEWEEAVFWTDVEECVEVCKKLLANDTFRERITLGGMKRVRENKVGNEDICNQILEEIRVLISQ
jgi:spore maturation protein CgeB